MYTQESITGKQRKVGGEAPSSRVFTSETDEIIIGMMAANVQLLVSAFSLKDEKSKSIINTTEGEPYLFERDSSNSTDLSHALRLNI